MESNGSLFVGLAGLVISISGFAVALWQLQRTQRVAQTAANAAERARERIAAVSAVTTLEQVISRSRHVVSLIRARDLRGAASGAFDLRESIARFHLTDAGKSIQSEEQWGGFLEAVATVHGMLEKAALANRMDKEARMACLEQLSGIHFSLSAISGPASSLTNYVLSDPAIVKRLREAQNDIQRGRGVTDLDESNRMSGG